MLRFIPDPVLTGCELSVFGLNEESVRNITSVRQLSIAVMLLVCVALLGGCADFTAGFAPLERTIDPTNVQAHTRAGKVYCARGWLGIFSTGMMELANRIDTKEGITAISTADMEYWRLQNWLVSVSKEGKLKEPLVLLGHSWGADDMVRVSKYLQEGGITIDLLVLIDPVDPPDVPTNVKRVFCVYKSNPATDWFPFWRGVPATVADSNKVTVLENIDLRTAKVDFDTTSISHPQVDKNEGVHDMCVREIMKVCPPRAAWQMEHPVSPVTSLKPVPGQTTVGIP
jgi:hypothetical protein